MAKKKFHFNKETGHTGECNASVRDCPLGGPGEHFDTELEAKRGYEKYMEHHNIRTHRNMKSTKSRTKESTPPLSSILNTEQLQKLIKENYVIVARHPEDPSMQILTYSTLAQISGKWNEVTKQTRGLIIRSEKEDYSDAVILERPWRKFFTLQQMTATDGKKAWSLGDEEEGASNSAKDAVENLDFEAPAEVTDKLDGSMGILYQAPDGKLALATKGSFVSDQAKDYTKMLRENPKYYKAAEKLRREHPDTTFLYEMIGPENQVVLEYDDPDIVMLGAVNRETGKYYSTSDYADTWGEKQGLSVSETMPAKNLQEALSLPHREKREGVVVRIMSEDPSKQMQVKIKQEDYLKLHRMMTGFSFKAAREVVRDSQNTSMSTIIHMGRSGKVEDMPDVAAALEPMRSGKSKFHERLYEKHKASFERALLPHARAAARSYDYIQALPKEVFEGSPNTVRKEFVASIQDKPKLERSMLINFFNARMNQQPMEEMRVTSILHSMSQGIGIGKEKEK